MKIATGIDFGTTNTTAAIARPGEPPRIVPIEDNAPATPSAIFFAERTNRPFFGRAAVQKYMDDDSGRFMRSLKRILGTDIMGIGTNVNGRNVPFRALIGAFIKNVKSKLDAAAGEDVERVVMGRPVHFRDDDAAGDARAEKELEQIVQDAGFKEVLFQYEPIAAAFAHEPNLRTEQLAVVVDIGGGTSDFAVLRIGGPRASHINRKDDILAATGVRIGGNDFDRQLSLASFMPEFGMGAEYNAGTVNHPKWLPVPNGYFFDLSEWSQVNSLYAYKNINMINKYWLWSGHNEKLGRLVAVAERALGHKVLASVEDAKIALTNYDTHAARMDFISPEMTVMTTRAEFEKSIVTSAAKISASARECLRLAGVSADDIQLIILTGGSTEIPYIRDRLCGLFPNAATSGDNRLSSVGLGLAFDAARRFF